MFMPENMTVHQARDWVDRDSRRQGLASEAVQEITSRTMQFGAVDKVVARPDARNERSIRLLERIGFESEGEATFHDEDGEQREIIYARTRPRQKKPSRRR